MDHATLQLLWFIAISGLFVGYFVLEGFDFGIGMLLPTLARNNTERRVMINTIGPVWDGNEVWVVMAIGAMFAAFPEWYATMFSGFYLPFLLLLAALVIRAVGFEYRGKRDDPRWQQRWDAAIVTCSTVPTVVWGLLLGNIVTGVPLDVDHEFVGGLTSLLQPFALLMALLTTTLFATHAATFIALKTTGDIRGRARKFASRLGLIALAVVTAVQLWHGIAHSDTAVTWLTGSIAVIALAGGLAANARGREGWAFVGTSGSIMASFTTLFVGLFPTLLPSTGDPAGTLTISNASSSPYTLMIISISAAIGMPLVLLYQGWSYWVFRRRIGTHHIPTTTTAAGQPVSQ